MFGVMCTCRPVASWRGSSQRIRGSRLPQTTARKQGPLLWSDSATCTMVALTFAAVKRRWFRYICILFFCGLVTRFDWQYGCWAGKLQMLSQQSLTSHTPVTAYNRSSEGDREVSTHKLASIEATLLAIVAVRHGFEQWRACGLLPLNGFQL